MKDGPCWLREEEEEEMRRKREPSFRGDNIWCRCSLLSPPTVFPSRSCFLSRGIIQAVGESSGANGDINLPQQESGRHQSGALNPALNDVHTPSSITHAWKQFITFPFHQTCHGLTRPVLRSSISPVSGCLPPAITPPHSPLTSERQKKKSISYVSKWCRADLHCY